MIPVFVGQSRRPTTRQVPLAKLIAPPVFVLQSDSHPVGIAHISGVGDARKVVRRRHFDTVSNSQGCARHNHAALVSTTLRSEPNFNGLVIYRSSFIV